ncbi:hypothetical protein Tco_0164131 [Tanacetum coccineum]
MGTCAPYTRREGFTPLMKTPKEILAMDNVNFPPPPPMVGTLEKRNMNKFVLPSDRGSYTNDQLSTLRKQIEEAEASGRLLIWLKISGKAVRRARCSAKKRKVPRYQLMNCPVVVEAMIEGFREKSVYPVGVIDYGSHYGGMRGKPERSINGVCVDPRVRPVIMPLLGRTGMRSLGAMRKPQGLRRIAQAKRILLPKPDKPRKWLTLDFRWLRWRPALGDQERNQCNWMVRKEGDNLTREEDYPRPSVRGKDSDK